MIIYATCSVIDQHFVMAITTGGMLLIAYAVHRMCERPIAAAMKPLLEQALARLRLMSAKREGSR